MQLNIDIELIDFNPAEAKRFGLIKKKLKFYNIIENSAAYTVKTMYRKTLHLGSYNEHGTLLQLHIQQPSNGQCRPLTETTARIAIETVPYSNYDLMNEGLKKVVYAFKNWLEDKDTDFKIIREGVYLINNIKPNAERLLSMLFQIFMQMKRMDEQFFEIFLAITNVISKLDTLSGNKGTRFLQLFLKEKKNEQMLINVYPKLIDAILHVSNEIQLCAESEKLLERLNPDSF